MFQHKPDLGIRGVPSLQLCTRSYKVIGVIFMLGVLVLAGLATTRLAAGASSTSASSSLSTSLRSALLTQTPGSPTATPVPTTCSIQFPDVPPDSPFYPFIHCLACHGIIGGFPDGTFRPGADVSRGQLSKIISNAAGYNDPGGAQRFQDVPPDSPYFDYIERLWTRNIVSGYTCGFAPGYPCVPPDNLGYFLPNAYATRAQISKMVAVAAGYFDQSGDPVFEDVLADNIFYPYVQGLAHHQVMGGYPCGGPGELCDAENRPYFRPGNNTTRGQLSKIVANTFFPDCQTYQSLTAGSPFK